MTREPSIENGIRQGTILPQSESGESGRGGAMPPSDEAWNLLSCLDIAGVFLGPGLQIGSFTPRAAELLGLREEDRGRSMDGLQARLDVSPLLSDVREALDGRETRERELWDEAARWYLARLLPYRDLAGEVRGVLLHFMDITEARRLRAVLDASPDSIFLKDSRSRLLLANQATFKVIGKPAEHCLGKSDLEFYDDAEVGRCMEENDRKILATGESQVLEERIPMPEGDRTYLSTKSPLRDVNERILGIVGVARDVTELVEARIKLKDTNALLERRVEERTRELVSQRRRLQHLALELAAAEHRERKRLASLLHDDLQQHLVALKIQLSHARDQPDVTEMRSILELALEIVDQARESSKDLTRELRPPVLYEDGLPAALRWLAGDMAKRYGLKVTVATDGWRIPLTDDMRAMLYQNVRELLINVVKHAGVCEAALDCRQQEGKLVLRVTDRGKGFGDREIDERKKEGGGLGLFSMRERLETVGGSMEVAEVPGGGVAVTLSMELRIADGSLSSDAPNSDSSGSDFGGRVVDRTKRTVPHLLVVEDHAIVRQGLVNMLSNDPRVRVAGEAVDGEDALRAIEHLEPDVVLMDVYLPKINGIEATRRLRRRWPEIQVIGLSVQDDAATAHAMLRAGAASFLTKSDEVETMIQSVLQALS